MLLLVFKGTLVGTEAMQLHMFSQSVKSLIKHNKYTIKTADRGQCPTIMYELSQCFLVIQQGRSQRSGWSGFGLTTFY